MAADADILVSSNLQMSLTVNVCIGCSLSFYRVTLFTLRCIFTAGFYVLYHSNFVPLYSIMYTILVTVFR